MDKSTVLFWIALGVVIGIPLGVLSVAKAALIERELYGQRKHREGFEEACADPAIRRLRQHLYRVK